MFETAQDRILYSQAVDYIEQGRCDLVPRESLDDYVRRGLLEQRDGTFDLTEIGRSEYMTAKNERSAEG